MGVLNKEAIFKANDIKLELVKVPEWGGEVYIRPMTGTERDQYEAAICTDGKKVNLANFRARVVALTVCDETGNRLFSDSDIETLGKKSSKALDRVFAASKRLSGLSKEDMDELVKNSDATPSDSSGSN